MLPLPSSSRSPVLLSPTFDRADALVWPASALSGCQRVVEPPSCPSYVPTDRCLQSFETYRRLNATPWSPLHGCTRVGSPPPLPLFAHLPLPLFGALQLQHHDPAAPYADTKVASHFLSEHDSPFLRFGSGKKDPSVMIRDWLVGSNEYRLTSSRYY